MKWSTSTEWPSFWKSWEGEEHCHCLGGAFHLAHVSHWVKAKPSHTRAVFSVPGLQPRLKITLALLSESVSHCCRALTTPLWLWNQIIRSQHCGFLLPPFFFFPLRHRICFLFAVSSTGSRCLWRRSTSSSSWRCSSRCTQRSPCPCSTRRYQKCPLLSHTRFWVYDEALTVCHKSERHKNGLFFCLVTLLWRPWWRYGGNALVQWFMWIDSI